MKKGAAIGIGLSIIAISVIFGIASLPDEVLIENPSLETSKISPIDEGQTNTLTPDMAEEPTPDMAEEPTPDMAEEPTPDTVAEESDTKSSKENIIKVEILDGIGSGDR